MNRNESPWNGINWRSSWIRTFQVIKFTRDIQQRYVHRLDMKLITMTYENDALINVDFSIQSATHD